MSSRPDKNRDNPATAREERLKAALKSNIARRKAQGKAREDTNRTQNDHEQ